MKSRRNFANVTSALQCFIALAVCVQILQTGQEIMELDTSGFATQGPTVYAGNIGDNKYIIQVSPMGIRLLEGGKGAHHQCIFLTMII